MYRCVYRFLTRGWPCLLLLVPVGCNETAAAPAVKPPIVDAPRPSRFDATTVGTVHGRVLWEGELPVVPPLDVFPVAGFGPPMDVRQFKDHPNVPVIDAGSRGVGSAVVFLRGIDREKARPWDHEPVRVEQRDGHIHVVQGPYDGRVGLVRRGDAAVMVSLEPYFHLLRATGATFFALPMPDPDLPVQRCLNDMGCVELSSAAGYYWMRAHLLVDDHPYYVRTDAQGRFTLRDVPPGRYQAACWHPSWIERQRDLDPDSLLIMRLYFRPPVILEQPIVVERHGDAAVDFTLSAARFQ